MNDWLQFLSNCHTHGIRMRRPTNPPLSRQSTAVAGMITDITITAIVPIEATRMRVFIHPHAVDLSSSALYLECILKNTKLFDLRTIVFSRDNDEGRDKESKTRNDQKRMCH